MEPDEDVVLNDLLRGHIKQDVQICSDYDDGGVKVWYKDEDWLKPKLIMHADQKQMRYLLKHLFEEWYGLLFHCYDCEERRRGEK